MPFHRFVASTAHALFIACAVALSLVAPASTARAHELVMVGDSLRWMDVETPLVTFAPAPRSPAMATALSIAATVVPATVGLATGGAGRGVAVAGLALGPAVGFMYGRASGRGAAGAALRLALGITTLAVAYGARGSWRAPHDAGRDGRFAGGFALTSVAALWDLAVVGRHVSAKNHALGATAALVPARLSDGSPGLALRLVR